MEQEEVVCRLQPELHLTGTQMKVTQSRSAPVVQDDGSGPLCPSGSLLIGQIQFCWFLPVMLQVNFVCLWRGRLCRDTLLGQEVEPPAGRAGYLHL